MAETRPKPMTPPDCDLRGMEWMPLYGHRLFGSDFDAHASDAEFRAGLNLWWAAWNQVPAASLPNDETALCRLAGCGRDLKTWRKVNEHALHGFIECSDGRLYHKAQVPFALESWERRLKDRERKAKWREKKAEKAAGQNADGDIPEAGTEQGRDADGDGDATRTGGGTERLIGRDATGRDATGRDLNKEDSPDFAEWYAAYPRHAGRGQAVKAYRSALKKTTNVVLLAGARAAAKHYAGSDPKFIPHPATWLNGERWADAEKLPSEPASAHVDDLTEARIYRGLD